MDILTLKFRGFIENNKIYKIYPEWKTYTKLLKKLNLYNNLPYTLANIRVGILNNLYDPFVKEQLSEDHANFCELLEYAKVLEPKHKINDRPRIQEIRGMASVSLLNLEDAFKLRQVEKENKFKVAFRQELTE